MLIQSRQSVSLALILAAQFLLLHVPLATAAPKHSSLATSIILQVRVEGGSTHPVWCYASDPTLAFGRGRAVILADITGKLQQQIDSADLIGSVLCSEDGNTIEFINPRSTRLSIYSRLTSELSEYGMTPPALFHADADSLMSSDGNAFALPSEPKLISGPDILHDKRVLRLDTAIPLGAEVFWTKNILFIPLGEKNEFRMLRTDDFAEIGNLKLDARRPVQGIFECGKSYFVLYSIDELQRRILKRIDDQRLQPRNTTALMYDNVGAVDQSNGMCTVSLVRDFGSIEKLDAVSIWKDGAKEQVDLHNFDRLAYWLSASPDRRMLLGAQVAAGGNPEAETTVTVLQIKK